MAEWEREASVRLRDGDMAAVAAYDRHGRIRAADEETAYDRAASMWLADHLRGKDVLLLAGSNAEAAELSRRVQARLVRLGDVGPPTAVLADGNHAGTGDLVRARLNTGIDAGGRTLTNRDTLQVTGWRGPDAEVRRQRLDGTWTEPFRVPLSYLAHNAELAYAGNVHVAQGRTVDTAPEPEPQPGQSGQQHPRPRRSLSPRHLSRELRSPKLPDPSPLMTGTPPGSMGCRPARTKPRAASTRSGHSSTPAASTPRGSSGKHRSSRKLPGRQRRPVEWTGRDQAALALTERADTLRFSGPQERGSQCNCHRLPRSAVQCTIRGSVRGSCPRFSALPNSSGPGSRRRLRRRWPGVSGGLCLGAARCTWCLHRKSR